MILGVLMAEENQTAPSQTEEQLRALVARYEKRLDEIAELVAHVRHELNNPLTGVLGQAQLLLREELSEKARKRVQTIEELATRLRDVTGELREVQKPIYSSGEHLMDKPQG
jgi:signal transduction histidine kinase